MDIFNYESENVFAFSIMMSQTMAEKVQCSFGTAGFITKIL